MKAFVVRRIFATVHGVVVLVEISKAPNKKIGPEINPGPMG